eukprot:scaffold11948_cov107-Isochrysis_galbana.AAC.5
MEVKLHRLQGRAHVQCIQVKDTPLLCTAGTHGRDKQASRSGGRGRKRISWISRSSSVWSTEEGGMEKQRNNFVVSQH